jgi:hypothetical protein
MVKLYSNPQGMWYNLLGEHMKRDKTIYSKEPFLDEDREWLGLSPARRFLETTKLWKIYIALGGSLDPEPDPQSPFYPQKI